MDSLSAEIKQLWENLVAEAIRLIPNLVLAVVVFLSGFVVARVVQKLIYRFILYLNRNINKNLGDKFLSVDLKSSANIIAKSSFWIILVFTIVLVAQILELSILTLWFDDLMHFVPDVLAAALIVFCGFIVGKLVHDLIASAASRSGISTGKNIAVFIQHIIQFISIIIAIDQVGIDILFLTNLVTVVLAVLLFGAALAFGLGSKGSVSNILASYYIQKIYQVGNTIQIGDITGVIMKITNTSVILETDRGQVAVPAKDFNNEKTILIKKK